MAGSEQRRPWEGEVGGERQKFVPLARGRGAGSLPGPEAAFRAPIGKVEFCRDSGKMGFCRRFPV